MDVITLIIIGFGTAIGYKRGLVLEITDWLILGFAGLVAFRGFRPLGAFTHHWIKGWPAETCNSFAFWFLLLLFGLIILTSGLHVDRSTREYDRIPPEVRNYGGAVSAFLKCTVICCLISAYLPYSNGLAAAEKVALRKSASATTLRSVGSIVGVFVSVITPEDISQKFRDAIKP